MNILPDIRAEGVNDRPEISGSIGALTTRLAVNPSELKQAQRIRYQVFCEEMSARKNITRRLTKRDQDAHDKICDHLLVVERCADGSEKLVGTQRFFVRSASDDAGKFYSQPEFDLESLAARYPESRFMELGRSCILPEYRGKRTMELLWHGTWAYALQKKADVMIGCASFEASRFEQISDSLAFLAEHALCDEQWNAEARAGKSAHLASFSTALSPKRGLASLPPLIKGYLRLGAKFGHQAVADPDFGTIDVLVVLPVSTINPRYVAYYGADASRHKN